MSFLQHNYNYIILWGKSDLCEDVKQRVLKEAEYMIKTGATVRETAKIYQDLGGYFSFGGVITFKNAKKEEIIKSIPKERILLETDCPYMAPEPFRGKLNTPEYMPYIYKKVADIYGEGVTELAKTVKANFERFFKK